VKSRIISLEESLGDELVRPYMNAGIKLATKAERANANQKPVVRDRFGGGRG
jgi:hypothetical protein